MMHCSSVQVKCCQSQPFFFPFKVQNRKNVLITFSKRNKLTCSPNIYNTREPSLCYLKMVHIKKNFFLRKIMFMVWVCHEPRTIVDLILWPEVR